MEAAFITNISFPKSLDEVLYFIDVRGHFDVEEVLEESYVEWTAPKDAHIGEQVFFMHAKTSIDTIRSLKKQRKEMEAHISPDANKTLIEALDKAEKLYQSIGGCVFARGKVCGEIIVDNVARSDGLHWRSVYYAPIGDISVIEPPINISEFRDFIKISRTGAITKLDERQEKMLLSLRGL